MTTNTQTGKPLRLWMNEDILQLAKDVNAKIPFRSDHVRISIITDALRDIRNDYEAERTALRARIAELEAANLALGQYIADLQLAELEALVDEEEWEPWQYFNEYPVTDHEDGYEYAICRRKETP
jgi:hypothetical protein